THVLKQTRSSLISGRSAGMQRDSSGQNIHEGASSPRRSWLAGLTILVAASCGGNQDQQVDSSTGDVRRAERLAVVTAARAQPPVQLEWHVADCDSIAAMFCYRDTAVARPGPNLPDENV